MDLDIENFEPATDNVDNPSEFTEDIAPEGSDSPNGEQPDAFDLSTVEKVKVGDRVLTRDELEKGIMRQEDYTKKTQEIGRDRKFMANLESDLKRVSEQPELARQFKEIYPEKFHNFLKYVIRETKAAQPTTTQTQREVNGEAKDGPSPELLSRLEKLEQQSEAKEVEAREQEIDSMITKLSPKYPLAIPKGNESYVLELARQVVDANKQLTPQVWEKIFQHAHKHFESAFTDYQQHKIKLARERNQRGLDQGAGGGTPGQKPRTARTFEEATNNFIQDMGVREKNRSAPRKPR